MFPVDYIVRIYRHEKDKPGALVGTVEEVGVEEKRAFANLDELWSILNTPTGSVTPAPSLAGSRRGN